MTADDDWWLERVTMDGKQRYPERIRVGSLERPRVYVPERTCQIVVSIDRNHVCSACGGPVDGGDRYCKHCGARLADNHEKE